MGVGEAGIVVITLDLSIDMNHIHDHENHWQRGMGEADENPAFEGKVSLLHLLRPFEWELVKPGLW